MKLYLLGLILFIFTLNAQATTRDFCFRAYTAGITSFEIDDTNGTATFWDNHILQQAMTAPINQIAGQNVVEVDTDNTMGYMDVVGPTIRFSYTDLGNQLTGQYALLGNGVVFAGGPFIAYLKTSSDCQRPQAPANLPNNRPLVSTVVVNPDKILEISKFNSGYGHSYTSDTSCRTQNHRFRSVEANDTKISLRLPNTVNNTSWKVWSWIWEDDPADRSVIYQNQDAPWLFLKIHHVIDSKEPVINEIIAGDQIVGVARHNPDEQSSFNLSVEYIDHLGRLRMTSIFNLYQDAIIANAYPTLATSGVVNRTAIINPDNYEWSRVEVDDASITPPALAGLLRQARCLGNNPPLVAAIFPHALSDNYVVHVSDLVNYVPPRAGVTNPSVCADFNLVEIAPEIVKGFCRLEEHRDDVFVIVQ